MSKEHIHIWFTPSTLHEHEEGDYHAKDIGSELVKGNPKQFKNLTEVSWNWKMQLDKELVLPKSEGENLSKIWPFIFVMSADRKMRVDYFQIMPTSGELT